MKLLTQLEGYKQKYEECLLNAEALEEAGEDEEAYYARGFARDMYREWKRLENGEEG